MMIYRVFSFLCLLAGCITAAQAQDTLWVQQQDNKPYLLHRIRNGETLALLAKRYTVPLALLADRNDVTYQDGLKPGRQFQIPIDKYNYVRIESMVDSRPLYYRPEPEDNLHSISRMFNVSQSTIQRWNRMDDADVNSREPLLVGWISYDKTQQPFPATAPPPKPDTPTPAKQPIAKAVKPLQPTRPLKDSLAAATAKAADKEDDSDDADNSLAQQFREENQGMSPAEESGAAVFYPLKSAPAGIYYAFHNSARKGSVLKVLNPASNKMIYAKVIGPIPNLKEYHNAVIALSSNAMQALGAREKRMFCKLKYR